MSLTKVKTDMVNSNPLKAILLFVIPMMLGNLFQQFYNVVDSVIVGKFVGMSALASVGASYSVTAVFIAVASGGSMGCAVIISQYFGACDYNKMKTCISTFIITFLAISVFLAVLGAFSGDTILSFIKTPESSFKGASEYLRIYFYGLPFLFMYNVLSAVFNSMGDSRTPLTLLLFSSVLNIFMDLYFVVSLNMGISGAAWATLIAQGTSAIISFLILIKKLSSYKTPEFHIYNPQLLPKMASMAIPSILQQSIISTGTLLVQSVINSFGESVLAGYTAGNKIHLLLSVFALSMGNASSTFTAQNIGAKKYDRVGEGYIAGHKIVLAVYTFVLIAVFIFARNALSIFLDESADEVAFSTGISFLRFICVFYYMFGFKTITDGVLKGSGDVFIFTLSNLINLSIRVSFAFIFAPVIGACAVWYAVPAGWSVNYIIGFLRYRSGKWKSKKVIN